MVIFGPIMEKMSLNNTLNRFIDVSASVLPKTIIFMIWGFLDVSRTPKTNIIYLLETPGHLKKIKKNPWNIFENIRLCL